MTLGRRNTDFDCITDAHRCCTAPMEHLLTNSSPAMPIPHEELTTRFTQSDLLANDWCIV